MKLKKSERIEMMRNLSLLAAIKSGKSVPFTEATALEMDLIRSQFAPFHWGYPNGSHFQGIKLAPKANRMCRIVSVDNSVYDLNWNSAYYGKVIMVFAVRETEQWRLISVDLTPRKNLTVDFGAYFASGIIDTNWVRYKDVMSIDM